ncbi:MAG: extracellular solute-binding protein [Eubacterium sp.]
MKRLGVLLLIALMMGSALTGCTKTFPLKQSANTPVTLTMLCHLEDAEAKAFAEGIHQKLPHITIDYEACPIGSLPYGDEVTRRVMNDVESDIFMTTDTQLWDSGKLLNLTDEAFTSKYNLSLMKTLSGDGSVYFVPGMGDVLCYIYNVKWLEELGLQPPQSNEDLDNVFAAMSSAGKQPFIVPYSQMPTQYVKVMIAGYLSTPDGQQWLNDYNQGKTTMAQDAQWQELWKRAEEMTQKGYLSPEDMIYTESRRMVRIQEDKGFMTTFSSSQSKKFSDETKDKFQVLPLVGEKPENQMVYTAPTAYFALSDKLNTSENRAKRVAALEVLDFISTDEGQALLCGNNPLAISYLSGTTLPIQDKYSNLDETIKKGAYTQMPTLERGVEKVIEETFKKLVEGKITAEDAVKACDAQNKNDTKAVSEKPPVIGTATELFPWTYMQSRTEELAIIDFCMDSVRKAAGTDYALEIGTAFRGEFFKGDITADDVASVIRQDKKMYRVKVTGQQVWDIINQGASLPKGSAWFIAPSGFRYTYERLEDGTGKLLEVTLEDGKPIDLKKSYTVAVSENQIMSISKVITFSEVEKEELPFTLREAVITNIKEQGEITPKTDGRIKVVTP